MTVITVRPTSNSAGTTGLTNPENAYSSNNVYATAAPAQSKTVSSYFGGFNLKNYLDNQDIINSVKIGIERKFSTTSSIASTSCRAYDNTTALETNQTSTAEPTSDTVWEHTIATPPTVKQLMSDNFRVLVGIVRGNSTTTFTGSIDDIYVTVDYSERRTYKASTMMGIG